MSVVNVKSVSAGLSGEVSGDDSSEQRSFRVRYLVRCDQPTDTAETIVEHFRKTSGLPYLGDPYEFGGDRNAKAVCRRIAPTSVDRSGGYFVVDVDFEPKDSSGSQADVDNQGKKTTNPLDWHDEVEVDYTQLTMPVEYATFRGFEPFGIRNFLMKPGEDMAITNSAMQPFDPPVEEERKIKIVRFIKNIPAYDGKFDNGYLDTVNSDFVQIDKPECNFRDEWLETTARIVNISSSFNIANDIKHWRRTIEVHIHPVNWRRSFLDRGTSRRRTYGDPNGSGGTVSPSDVDLKPGVPHVAQIVDVNGFPVSEPVLLDGNGQPLADLNDDPVFLVWSIFAEQPFAGIDW